MSSNGFPLQSWRLGGFRSIRDSTDFQLGGLNLLVGANSAGKSSMLHSVLMAAQTLGNPLADRPLVLNGPLVRLGLAEDTVHEQSDGRVTLGFALIPISGARQTGMWRSDFGRLKVDAVFRMTRGGDFELAEASLLASPSDASEPEQRIRVATRTQTAAEASYRKEGLSRALAREAARGAPLSAEGTLPTRTGGARARQFLPDQLWGVVNEYEQELEQLGHRYLFEYDMGRAADRRRTDPISAPTMSLIRRYLAENFGEEAAAHVPRKRDITMGELVRELGPARWDAVQELLVTRWYARHKEDLPFRGALARRSLPPALDGGADHARRWFQAHVRHLGPLRAAPQPLHGLPEAASGTSVGRNGEYTAAVLSAHARRPVTSPDPQTGVARQLSLGQAVDEWMGAMDLLSSVRSEERGKLGYELRLNVEGVQRDLDLTTVGVGVSQALPVVVLGLITSPGSLLLFEQPELHLHPDVQAGLGDFFLALAGSGRQLIVETHSEYLINRLRRRAATGAPSDVADLVRLFFFERSGSTSKVTATRIAPGGGMPDWPRGFLDTAAREIKAIADASRGRT